MRSLACQRPTRRGRAVPYALALSALLAPAAPAAVRTNALISVTGTHNFNTFGVWDVSGGASIKPDAAAGAKRGLQLHADRPVPDA